jgi:soluble lytic murein transglycosylase-like protein
VKFLLQIAIALAVTCGTSLAADLAVLRNGNSIRHERREVLGSVTRLYMGASSSGYIEIPTDQIERFEKDTAPPPAQPVYARQAQRVAPQKQEALTREALNQAVSGAGERHQIDPDFINSVIRAESGFHQNAVSRKGALGLMQLMPGTASQLGVSNPFDPNSNIEGGTKYLRDLLVKYNFDVNKALAAYNAGPKRVDQYHGVPPYFETQAYISRIIRDFNRQKIAENPALAKRSAAAGKRSASTRKASVPQSSTTSSSRSQQNQSGTVQSAIPKSSSETTSR